MLPLKNSDIVYIKRLQSISSGILKCNHIIHVQWKFLDVCKSIKDHWNCKKYGVWVIRRHKPKSFYDIHFYWIKIRKIPIMIWITMSTGLSWCSQVSRRALWTEFKYVGCGIYWYLIFFSFLAFVKVRCE